MDNNSESYKKYHTLSRIYYNKILTIEDELIICEKEIINYLANVLRLKNDSKFRIFNQNNGEFLGKIVNLNKKEIKIYIDEHLREPEKFTYNIELLCAPIKQNNWLLMLEKITELGINIIQPILTDRTIVRKINFEKINSVIIEASEQCERITLPKIKNLVTIKDISFDNYDLLLFCDERENEQHLFNILLKNSKTKNIGIIVGPEGGFTKEEHQFLFSIKQIIPVKISNNILRAETASMVAVNLCKSYLDSL